jgi:multidrug efflux system outer membrane protein
MESFDGAVAGEVGEQGWWLRWNDPVLVQLVEEALTSNHDMAAAIARLEVAEAQVRRAAAPLWPTLSFDGAVNAQPLDSLGFQFKELFGMGQPAGGGGGVTVGGAPSGPELPEVLWNTSAMFNLRYPVDLWGRTVLTYRASQALREAALGDRDAFAAALTIQVGTAYADMAAAQQQIVVIEEQIELNRSLLELIQLRYEQGQATGAEVLQQRQQLAAAEALLPQARAVGRMARQRLNVLRGQRPNETDPVGVREAGTRLLDLSRLPPLPGTGRPAQLLNHRPDLRAAQARLVAAERQVRAARRAALPTLALSAQAGGQGFRANEFRHQGLWGAGVSLSVPLFQGLSEYAAIREARAQVRAAEETLHQAALQAVAEVEGALASAQEQEEQRDAHQRMLEAAQQAFSVTRDSYAAGIGTYVSVLAALGARQQAELTMVQTRRAVVGARLQLWQALGGAWTQDLGAQARSDQE